MNQKTQSIIHLGTTICLIHCIITPLLIIYAPFFGHFFHNIWVEIGLLNLSYYLECSLFIMATANTILIISIRNWSIVLGTPYTK